MKKKCLHTKIMSALSKLYNLQSVQGYSINKLGIEVHILQISGKYSDIIISKISL